MLDFKTEIVSALEDILPVRYEYFCDSTTPKPCITYAEYINNERESGDNICFSQIGYTIKVWDTSISDITEYCEQIDEALRPLGWTRDSSMEMVVDNEICKVLKYTAYCEEHLD